MPNNNNIRDNQDIISYQYLQNLSVSFTSMISEENENGHVIRSSVNTSQQSIVYDNASLSFPINIGDIQTEYEQHLMNSILSSNERPINFMRNIS